MKHHKHIQTVQNSNKTKRQVFVVKVPLSVCERIKLFVWNNLLWTSLRLRLVDTSIDHWFQSSNWFRSEKENVAAMVSGGQMTTLSKDMEETRMNTDLKNGPILHGLSIEFAMRLSEQKVSIFEAKRILESTAQIIELSPVMLDSFFDDPQSD